MTLETCHASHNRFYGGSDACRSVGKTCLARHQALFFLCTPNKKNTHDERNRSAMQHFTYTLKGFRSSDARLNLESHASAKTSLDVPPRLNPLKAKTVRMETGHTSHRRVFGGSVVSWSGGNTCLARDLTLTSWVVHTERKRHTLTAEQNHSILLFERMQKFRCTSEIRQHKLQQRLSLDDPPRFNHPKANTCRTEDMPHVARLCFQQLSPR